MRFHDIQLSEQFIDDYCAAPKEIQVRADRKVRRWARSGVLTKGDHAHKASGHPVHIIYLGMGLGGWRILLNCDQDVLHLFRLVNHAEMDRLLV